MRADTQYVTTTNEVQIASILEEAYGAAVHAYYLHGEYGDDGVATERASARVTKLARLVHAWDVACGVPPEVTEETLAYRSRRALRRAFGD